jgi:hypothetical protein
MEFLHAYIVSLWIVIFVGGFSFLITRALIRRFRRRPRITVAFPISCAACGVHEKNTNLKFRLWRGRWYDENCLGSIRECP